MFILALRDAYGLKIAVWLILVWNLYFLTALYAGISWLSVGLVGVSVAVTCYCSVLLCRHREDLIFNSKFAKEHAFPSSPRIAQATFNMHLTGFLLFFLGPLLATSIVAIRPLAVEKMPLLYAGYLMGLPSMVGLIHHFVRRGADRKAKQTKSM